MNNEIEIVRDISDYYYKSCSVANEFGGPSVYFHVEAIKEQGRDFLSKRHIEMIYATLASWGMHRVGDPADTKAKMVEFYTFRESLLSHRERLSEFCGLRMDQCSGAEYRSYLDGMKGIFAGLKVSIASSILVGNSKTLAHVLPYLLPPIDRQHTIRFFTQDNKDFFSKSGKYKNVAFPLEREDQFLAFKDYCTRIKRMFDQCDKTLFEINPNTFNTSYPKIMDNVIMAFVKSVLKPFTARGGE